VRAIIAARPLHRTAELRDVVTRAVHGPPKLKTKSLSRVFQAFRIAVNDELGALEDTLVGAAGLVRPGGRLVVLSYHSLEDRRVKRVMRSGSLSGTVVSDMYGTSFSPWKNVGKMRKPADAEVGRNSRARSAVLRVAERVVEPSGAGSGGPARR